MEKINIEKAKQDVEINEFNLQEEWALQPILFLNYSILVAELTHERDTLRSNKADAIVKEYEITTNKKASEAYIERMLETDKELIDLQLELSIAKNIVNAFHHRKSALENSVILLINGMHAEPKSPEDKEAIRKYIMEKMNNGKEAE